MNAKDILQFLTSNSATSMRAASQMMGRSPTFLATSRALQVMPKLDTMANIADVYGYDLILRNRVDGKEIVIDPSEK